MGKSPEDDTYTDEETKLRAAAALHRMLTTPHKPHKAQKASAAPTVKPKK